MREVSMTLETHVCSHPRQLIPWGISWRVLYRFEAITIMRSTPMSVDVTQIRHYSRLIPRYSNYYYSIKLTFVLGIRMGDYSIPPSLSLSLFKVLAAGICCTHLTSWSIEDWNGDDIHDGFTVVITK